MSDPYKLAAMQILITLQAPAAIANNAIALPILYTMVRLFTEYGNSSQAAYAYGIYAVMVWQTGIIPDIDIHGFFQVSLELLERFDAREYKSKIYSVLGANILHWKEHAKETIEPLRQSIQSGLESGDIEYACHAVLFYCEHPFYIGEHLETVAGRQAQYIEMLRKSEQEYQFNYAKICAQVVLNLLDKSPDRCKLQGEIFKETEILPVFLNTNNILSIFSVYFGKTLLCYLFKDYAQAIENAKLAEKYTGFVRAMIIFSEYNLYSSLALLANYSNVDSTEQKEYMSVVAQNQEKMKYWADRAPMNFQHKYELVEAEKARVLGQTLEAMEYYDRAIAGAKENKYIQHEAIANELAGEFYLALGRQKVAHTYLNDAYYAYARWGAKAKVKDLEERYSELLAPVVGRKNSLMSGRDETIVQTKTAVTSTNLSSAKELDLSTIIKASQALSGKVHLEELLSNLMQVLLENAGAEKFYFIIPDPAGKWKIEAQCTGEQCQLISKSATENQVIPISLVNYVERTQESLAIDDATTETRFASDQRALGDDQQLLDLERFLEVVERSELHRFDRALDRGVRRHHHDLRTLGRGRRVQLANEIEPGEIRHQVVDHEQVEHPLRQEPLRFAWIGGGDDFVTLGAQRLRQCVQDLRFVVDDEYRAVGHSLIAVS